MKKILLSLLLFLTTIQLFAQDQPPTTPTSANFLGYYKITGGDTVRYINQTGIGWFKVAGRTWVTRNFQPAGNYLTGLHGDGTASGSGNQVFTLSTVNTNVGNFGTASNVPTITVNGKGQITAVSNTAIQISQSQVTGLVTNYIANNLSSTSENKRIYVAKSIRTDSASIVGDPSTGYGVYSSFGATYGGIWANNVIRNDNTTGLKLSGSYTTLQGAIEADIDINGVNKIAVSSTDTYISNRLNLFPVSTGTTNDDILTLNSSFQVNKIAISNLQLKSAKGVVNGYASLDGSGKVPLSQINDALLGAVNYQGNYNATTNSPALPTVSTSNKGYYWVVSVAGTQAGLTLAIGDWIISNGTAYQKIDNNNAIASVFGRVGVITAQVGDYASYYLGISATAANSTLWGSQAISISGVGVGDILQYTGSTWQNVVNTYSSPLIHSAGNTSIQIANTSQAGAISSTDWNTFNNKQTALNGTGFVKIIGTTISYDNSTYYKSGDSPIFATATATTFTGAGTGLTGIPISTGLTGLGTGVASVLSSNTGTSGSLIPLDANLNATVNNVIPGFQTIVTAAGTTVLTVSSPKTTIFTGSTTQTVNLPVASTLTVGQQFLIVNKSSAAVTITTSSGSSFGGVGTLAGTSGLGGINSWGLFTCVLNSGTTTTSWVLTGNGSGFYAIQSNSATFGVLTATQATFSGSGATPGLNVNSSSGVAGTILSGGDVLGSGRYTLRVQSAGAGTQIANYYTDVIQFGVPVTSTSSITSTSFVKSGGTSSQFLMADGSSNSDTYYKSGDSPSFVALTLSTAPTTSAGTYDILTRNTSTGVVEKKASTSFMTNPMVVVGDIIVGGTSGVPTRMGPGSTGDILNISGGSPVWSKAFNGSYSMTGSLTLSGINVSETNNINLWAAAGSFASPGAIIFSNNAQNAGISLGISDNNTTLSGAGYVNQYLQRRNGTIAVIETSTQITSGTTAPSSTPTKVGDVYVDTTNKKLYFATGNSSSADWIIAN